MIVDVDLQPKLYLKQGHMTLQQGKDERKFSNNHF